MFGLIPVDTLHGFVLQKGIVLPISIGQFYKLIVILILIFRFLLRPKALFVSVFFFALLILPTLYQIIKQSDVSFFFTDVIKISKYLTPLFAFLFFVDYLKREGQRGIDIALKLVKFSYIVLIGNVFLKYVGLGYPMYEYGNIGSKGYIYAGNEISALLVILSAIIAFELWRKGEKLKYFLFWALTFFAGLTIGSKTGSFGVLLIFLLIPLKRPSFKLNFKRVFFFVISLFALIPAAIYFAWVFIRDTDLFIRLQYFYGKKDFLTFLLSNRNVFFKHAYDNYLQHYNFIEKIIGIGQANYELLNNGEIVEIDMADILFSLGIMGLIYLALVNTYLVIQAIRFSKNNRFIYSKFVLLMILALFGISATAGHVYSSGMIAVFMGLLFSLMYFKKSENLGIENIMK
nr:O-antigen ligase family protein [Aequorivita echinoideorum]